MQKHLLATLFIMTVLMTSIVVTTLPAVSALTPSTINTDRHATASTGSTLVCGDHLCAPGEHEQLEKQLSSAQRQNFTVKTTTPSAVQTTTPYTIQKMPYSPTMMSSTWTTKTGTITSIQDPGQGHESHQLAVILPPSDKIYSGVISWTSSKPIQIVELTGPLGQGEDKGQPIWTTDGKTKFALTLVDLKQSTGTFEFTGNALAVHTIESVPFTISYSVSYVESSASDTVKSGTLTSIQDPGQGHESHQLALILPPSNKPYHGVLTYSASEPIQLVSLVGPIDPSDKKGQLVYTMDGKTWFALVFVEPGTQMGTWQFSGNALAVHTKNTTPFQVSYTVNAHN